jgi:hypothetical protein
VLAVELSDGTIRKSYTLPPAFPPSLRACEHTISADGGWHAYISAVTRDDIPRLVVLRCLFTWPQSDDCTFIADTAALTLGVGAGAPIPTSSVSDRTLWLSLAGGLVGFNVNVSQPDAVPRTWLFPHGAEVVGGLQYDLAGRHTYVMLRSSAGLFLRRFLDSGTGELHVHTVPGNLSGAPRSPSYVTVFSDKNALGFVEASGNLVTVNLTDAARVLTSIPKWCGAEAGDPCPLLIVYEPFVFK